MTVAEILASQSDTDLEDFASFLSDAGQDRFWRQIRETRTN